MPEKFSPWVTIRRNCWTPHLLAATVLLRLEMDEHGETKDLVGAKRAYNSLKNIAADTNMYEIEQKTAAVALRDLDIALDRDQLVLLRK